MVLASPPNLDLFPHVTNYTADVPAEPKELLQLRVAGVSLSTFPRTQGHPRVLPKVQKNPLSTPNLSFPFNVKYLIPGGCPYATFRRLSGPSSPRLKSQGSGGNANPL